MKNFPFFCCANEFKIFFSTLLPGIFVKYFPKSWRMIVEGMKINFNLNSRKTFFFLNCHTNFVSGICS